VLLLDEAQNYAMSGWEDIRMLLGLKPARAAGLRTDPESAIHTYSPLCACALIARFAPGSPLMGFRATINLVTRAAWIQAAKDESLQISATHLQSALDLVPRRHGNPPELIPSMTEPNHHRPEARSGRNTKSWVPIGARTPRALLQLDRSLV
jgi:hypothetical protein